MVFVCLLTARLLGSGKLPVFDLLTGPAVLTGQKSGFSPRSPYTDSGQTWHG